MGFFTEGSSVTSLNNIKAIMPDTDNFHEAAIAVVAESEYNFNQLMHTIGIYENTQICESGEVVYTEGVVRNFWEKVKTFFVSLLAKIKGIFAKFMTYFTSHFKTGKDFFEKYKKELAEKWGKVEKDKVKFVGYKFSNLDSSSNLNGLTISEAEKFKSEDHDSEAINDKIEEMRGKAVSGGKLTGSEFHKELFEHFRSNESAKEELSNISFSEISRVLSDGKKASVVEKSYKETSKVIEDAIKLCDKEQRSAVDDYAKDQKNTEAESKVAHYPNAVRIMKAIVEIRQCFIAAQMKAISDEIGQAKQFAAQVLRASVKESASWTHYDESSDDIFGAVKFQ